MLVGPVHYHHYLNNAFEDFTAELVINRLRKGALFIDIGAHFGYYTLLAGTGHPDCRIMAFEPAPYNYEVLKKNIELNGLKNVVAYDLAASDKGEMKNLIVAEHSSRSSFYGSHLSGPAGNVLVKTVAIDDLIKERPSTPVLIKVDVEGHEMAVLEGMKGLLKDAPDVELVMEFNPETAKRSGHRPEDILGYVGGMGFDLHFIDDEKREAYKLRGMGWEDLFGAGNYHKDHFNVLCVKKERSLSLCMFSHSAQLSGAERSLLELTTELIRDHGVLCTVVLPREGPLRKKLGEAGASTLVIDYSWWCGRTRLPEGVVRKALANDLNALYDRLEELEKINPDIVMTNTMVIPWGAVAAIDLDKPHVWYVREFGPPDLGVDFYLPFEEIVRLIDSSDLVITNSRAVRKALFGDARPGVTTLYNYIDIPDPPEGGTGRYFSRPGAIKLLIAGTIIEPKGQKDAVLAVKALVDRKKDAELILMGMQEPAYRRELDRLIKELGLEERVRCLDFAMDPYPIIGQADVVLLCSRNEAFGRVLEEAMLLKKPVIGANAGGVPELVREGFNGLLYEPGDHAQLADRIEYFLENREKIAGFGENGYRFAKGTFTAEKYGGEVYRRLMRLKGTPCGPAPHMAVFLKKLTGYALKAKNLQKDEKIRSLEAEMVSMRESLTWRALTRYDAAVEALLPRRTRRRKAYDHGLAGVRALLGKGYPAK